MKTQTKITLALFIFLIGVLMFLSNVAANDYRPHKQNTDFNFNVFSSNATQCNFTLIEFPDGNISNYNLLMQQNGANWNYTINGSIYSQVGVYCMYATCYNTTTTSEGVCREVTLSGEQRSTTTIVSDIILLLVVVFIILYISYQHKETDFEGWDKNIIKDHKNMGQTIVSGLLYTLFKNSFIWLYFLGWIGVLILKDIVYRFNSPEVYSYFTLMANVYSLGLILVVVFMIGSFATYMKGVFETLSDNNWGLGNGE